MERDLLKAEALIMATFGGDGIQNLTPSQFAKRYAQARWMEERRQEKTAEMLKKMLGS